MRIILVAGLFAVLFGATARAESGINLNTTVVSPEVIARQAKDDSLRRAIEVLVNTVDPPVPTTLNAIYESPETESQRLRRQADEAEQRERAVTRVREWLRTGQ